jgi:hypothetical protein
MLLHSHLYYLYIWPNNLYHSFYLIFTIFALIFNSFFYILLVTFYLHQNKSSGKSRLGKLQTGPAQFLQSLANEKYLDVSSVTFVFQGPTYKLKSRCALNKDLQDTVKCAICRAQRSKQAKLYMLLEYDIQNKV